MKEKNGKVPWEEEIKREKEKNGKVPWEEEIKRYFVDIEGTLNRRDPRKKKRAVFSRS